MAAMRLGNVTRPSAREPFDELMEKTPAADGVTYEEARVGGVAGWWCQPDDAIAGAALLCLHGGAYVVGSARAYRHFCRRRLRACSAAAVVGQGAGQFGVASCWCGGDAALDRLGAFRREYANARCGGPAVDQGVARFHGATLCRRARSAHGDLAGLPPFRIHLGEDEVLSDDSLRYSERIESVSGTVHSWEGMTHVFPSSVALLHAAREALDDIGDFLRQQILGDVDPTGRLTKRSAGRIEGLR